MHIRPLRLFTGSILVACLALPVQARVGVDEEGGAARVGAARPEGEGGGVELGYDREEGGFFIRSADGDSQLIVGGRVRGRFDYIAYDNDFDRDDTVTFALRQARLYFVGHVFGEENSFFMQVGEDTPNVYPEGETDSTGFEVFDAWIKHECSEAFAIKVGQFKVPFSRQNLTSGGKLQLPERAIGVEGPGQIDARDVGVEASGSFHERQVQYAFALTNGSGPNTLNRDDKIAVFGRLSVNPTGDYGYSEGDIEGSDSLASTAGASFYYRNGEEVDEWRANLDGGIKRHGLSVQGELSFINLDPNNGDSVTDESYYLQAGYFVSPSKFEVAGRAGRLIFDGEENDISEYWIGLNYFLHGHRMKAQAAYSLYDYDGINLKDNRFIAETQFWF